MQTFYSHHPCFSSVVAEHSEHFGKTINNLLPKCVSMESVDTGLTKDDLVKHKAIVNCADKMWSSFFMHLWPSLCFAEKYFYLLPRLWRSQV